MITLRNLALQRGTKPLFETVDLTIHPGQRVGLIGANGSGKSTLFQVLLGSLHPDQGEVGLPSAWVIAHVAQETPAVETPALEFVIDGDHELREVERAMRHAEGEQLAHLLAHYDAIGGYTAPARAGKLLHGLGFADAQLQQPVRSFSGGWRVRLNLAQALMCRSDLLLLDEPTNHLDLEAVIWLEDWLRGYAGTLILISHDREFLDAVVTHVARIEHTKITCYRGNYSEFERRRAEQLAQQQAAFMQQQREIEHLQRYVDRFRAQATKARQAQSRLKALERMELISAAHVDTPFHFEFKPTPQAGNPLLEISDGVAAYGGKAILNNLKLQVRPGERIGLIGANGAGKSTLIKLLAGELTLAAGRRIEGRGLAIGYFAQHQLEQLDPTASALLHLQRLDGKSPEQALRDFLGGFGFVGERAVEPVAPFSGGEKSRLALALLIWQRPNLLLLDEPTNHLDLEMRHALTVALQSYEGALVIVSHDRHLLRTCTDELFLVQGGACQLYAGDLEDYRTQVVRQELDETAEAGADKSDRKQQRRDAAARRQQLQPLTRKLKTVEANIERLQSERQRIEAQLGDPGVYEPANKTALQDLLKRQAEIRSVQSAAETEWLELSEAIEAASE
ncbi:MAG: ATP-binding cassette domain-containing protein [Thiotrichales bacterium]